MSAEATGDNTDIWTFLKLLFFVGVAWMLFRIYQEHREETKRRELVRLDQCYVSEKCILGADEWARLQELWKLERSGKLSREEPTDLSKLSDEELMKRLNGQ